MRRYLRRHRYTIVSVTVVVILIVAGIYFAEQSVAPTPNATHTFTLPPNCRLPGCQRGFNFTVSRIEILSLRYNAQYNVSAELDRLTSQGSWSAVRPAITGINGTFAVGACVDGTYRYAFSNADQGSGANENTIVASLIVALVNSTIAGCQD